MASEPHPQRGPQPGAEAPPGQRPDEAERLAELLERDAAERLTLLREQENRGDRERAGAATQGPEDERRLGEMNLTDPKAMRALAHPVRISLLELLGVTRTLTATQASELLGESPANCAFHLRTLAKYGLVREAGGGKGRERPWERTVQSISLSNLQEDPQAAIAARALANVWHERWLERVRRAFSSGSWPPGWEDGGHSSQSVIFLTHDETAEVAGEFRAIIDRYKDRQDDPSRRPAGALPVEFVTFAYPLAELARLGSPGEAPAGDAAKDEEADGG